MKTIATLTSVILAVNLVSAQSLSSGCISTLTSLVANPEFACLNAQALIPLATNPTQSVITPVNQWLQGMCSQPACTNDVISAAVSNVTTGCQSDLEAHGLQTSSSALSLVTPVIQLAYPSVRQIACLQDANDGNVMCATELLTDLQDSVGTLSVDKVIQVATQVSSSGISTLPSNVTCSNCVKQAYNIANKAFPARASQASSVLSGQCGASFVDGAQPSGVVEIASTASAAATSKSAAVGRASLVSSSSIFGIAATSLVAVFSAFVVLA
ncbi:hypothetical protein NEOLEDRAFT_1239736 [Neolentinus lepideus HHB14362 ss-1]|uniref:Uncharacterized protein n=1 Tax=Neolentinus lepideus HHB14362 ss-1 TaxID=1314782 RepID=A0A165UCP0_9AGAM|nr:hypothetical protein NEOLEDRAFT_1239736 [Neolentinus lepideus HHB14362 ss-1]